MPLRRALQVSVIVPAYGVAASIAETVESVLAQTWGGREVIVVNDGSPDSEALAAALEPFRSQITYLQQPNLGAGAARNTGIRHASGPWLAFLDGDDIWEADFLERQFRFLESNDLEMVWSDGWIFGDTADAGRRIMELRPCRGPVTTAAMLRQEVSVGTSATVVRRDRVMEVGGFDESLRRGQDFDLWLRLVSAGIRAGYNPEPLIHYRVREGNLSGTAAQQARRALDVLTRIREKGFLRSDDLRVLEERIPSLEADLHLELAKEAIAGREYRDARRLLGLVQHARPSLKLAAVKAGLTLAPGLTRWAVDRFGPPPRR